MQARIKVQNEVTIVQLTGRVDVETAEPFRAVCLRDFRGLRLVFDFSGLSFVGSQGILPFLETFQVLQETDPDSFKFSGMGVEFRRVFEATPLSLISCFETVDGAVASFYLPKTNVIPLATAVSTAVSAVPMANQFLSYRAAPTDDGSKTTSDSFESDEELDA